jgi:hypothetical protein
VWVNVNLRELGGYLKALAKYASRAEFTSNATVMTKARNWALHASELLTAETIAKEIPETNRKIMLSLQTFMVCIR